MDTIEIKRFLLNKGIPPQIMGFRYFTVALEKCQKEERYIRELNKSLFVEIGDIYKQNARSVERGLRHALTHLPKHTTISEFIAMSLIEIDEIEHCKGGHKNDKD